MAESVLFKRTGETVAAAATAALAYLSVTLSCCCFSLASTESGLIKPEADTICNEAVPDEEARTIQYRSCGRVCGMALYHGYLLSGVLSHCFLRLLLELPPTTIADLQAELNLEQEENAADFRGSDMILSRTLSAIGLEDTLTFTRQLSTKPEMEVGE